ncbi:isoprenylcysteine carboxylmethyltransferase family protein [Streptomyces sp. MBT65]|uniref:methyltransferase family protein n=1 Tax=Streptomyces sp. MBT65 TaxID=1488395 RepID=UPI00190CEF8F|nr:isoprenylcysteine carboxylmethyltransferase family protein [Streptomyces sp. MBT65]MBK3579158.1 isoprenylcysteine carboxylmethyltransferase family protein [Streptomyces sp. MBT65]
MGSLHSALVALTGSCVAIFVVAWIAGAVYFGVKSEAGLRGWARGLRRTLPRRALLIVGAYAFSLLIRLTPDSFWHHLQYWQPELALLGAALALASTALLLWARWVLGVMWASIPLVHEHHELRTEGPYRIVRHPIYTGLLGLALGGMLACGFGIWIVLLAAAVPWLLRRVRIEDGMMADRFGASYEAYRARVPALIPWTRAAAVGPGVAGSR